MTEQKTPVKPVPESTLLTPQEQVKLQAEYARFAAHYAAMKSGKKTGE